MQLWLKLRGKTNYAMPIRLSFLIFVVLFILTSKLFADSPISWGDISDQEWEVMSFRDDDEAKAIILADYGENYIDENGNSIFRRHVRIKILNPDESEFTDVVLSTIREDRRQSLSNLRAQTFNRDENGSVSRDRLRRRDFDSEPDGRYEITRFSLPNVREGSVIEYSYELTTRGRFIIQGWHFQRNEPTLHSEYRILIPEELIFQRHLMGFELFDTDETSQVNSGRDFGVNTFRSESYTLHRMVLKDAPAIRNEPNMSSRANYLNRVTFTLTAYLERGLYRRDLAQTWDDIAERLGDIPVFDGQIRSTRETRELAERLTAGSSTDLEKARALYNYVAGEITWNNRYSIYATDRNGVRDAMKNLSGNSAEKALTLLVLLRDAGIEANPVLINTRNRGYVNWNNPSLNNFSHVLIKTNLEEGSFLLDPLVDAVPFGLLNIASLNYDGLVIDNKSARKIGISAEQGSVIQTIAVGNIDTDGMISLQMQMRYSGYAAIAQRMRIKNEEEEAYFREHILGNNPDVELISHDIRNLDNPDETLRHRLEIKSGSFVSVAGDMMYINPFMISQRTSNPFRNRVRNFPVEFPYGIENNYSVTLNLPDGYELEYMPESQIIRLGDQTAYLLQIEQLGNIIQLNSRLIRNDVFFDAGKYDDIRNFYADIVDLNNEQIILRKVAEAPASDAPESAGENN